MHLGSDFIKGSGMNLAQPFLIIFVLSCKGIDEQIEVS